MLVVSSSSLASFEEQGLRALRQRILTGWSERLSAMATSVGEKGRAVVLEEIEAASRADPELTVGELQMLADLRLSALFAELTGAQN